MAVPPFSDFPPLEMELTKEVFEPREKSSLRQGRFMIKVFPR